MYNKSVKSARAETLETLTLVSDVTFPTTKSRNFGCRKEEIVGGRSKVKTFFSNGTGNRTRVLCGIARADYPLCHEGIGIAAEELGLVKL